MGKRISVTLGFGIGFAAACLLNPNAYSRMTSQAIASPISQGIANLLTHLSPEISSQQALAISGCSDNQGYSTTSLNSNHPVNISLLKHIPVPPRRLNWYNLTQGAAIANAPKTAAPKPAITQWTAAPSVADFATANLSAANLSTANLSTANSHRPCLAEQPNPLAQLSAQRSASLLQGQLPKRNLANFQQQTHFILSLASLNQKNDWLLEAQPEPVQPIHSIWLDQDPMSLKRSTEMTTESAIEIATQSE